MTTSRLEISVDLHNRLTSSVLSTGNQAKWRKDGLWIKANQFGYEDIAEWVATNVLKCSDVPEEAYTAYSLCNIKEDPSVHFNPVYHEGCYSRDFLKEGDNLLTFYRLFQENLTDWSKLLNATSTEDKIWTTLEEVHRITGLDVSDYLKITLTLDALIYNEDRHYNNLSVILNEEIGFRCAPIFDNGLSCLSDRWGFSNRTEVSALLRKVKSKPFCTSFKKQMNVLGPGFTVERERFKDFLDSNEKLLGRAYEVMLYSMAYNKEIYV